MPRFGGVLKSRKFWASLIGLLVSVGVLNYSDAQQAELASAVLTVATAIGYVLSVAIEDAGSARGGQLD